MTLWKQHLYLKIKLSYKKNLIFQKKYFSLKQSMQIWRRRCYYKWLRYILQRPTISSEVISIDRGSIITYRKYFEFDNEKKISYEKNDGWQDEEEAHKDGRIMSYRDGIEGWEVSQSKERRKLG